MIDVQAAAVGVVVLVEFPPDEADAGAIEALALVSALTRLHPRTRVDVFSTDQSGELATLRAQMGADS